MWLMYLPTEEVAKGEQQNLPKPTNTYSVVSYWVDTDPLLRAELRVPNNTGVGLLPINCW